MVKDYNTTCSFARMMSRTRVKEGIFFSSLFVILSLVVQAGTSNSCGETVSSYASANPNCRLSSNCTQLQCSWAGGVEAHLMVYNCEDPVRVVFSLHDLTGQHCNRTYAVSGDGSYDDVALAQEVLHVTHSRNASHLYFNAYTGNSPSGNSVIIPAVEIPLAPDICMYDDFVDGASSFHLPPPFVESCAAENKVCGGIQCNFTGLGEHFSTCITIDPCNETLQVTIWDSGDNVQYDEVFSSNRSVDLHPSVGPNFTLLVHLHHYNYSMDAQLSVVFGVWAFPLLPHRRFILDRTECSPFISFPAAPATMATEMICSTPSPGTPSPGTPSPAAVSCKDLAASYASSHPGCSLSQDCFLAKCSLPSNMSAELVVFNCEDPVRAVFTLTEPAGQCRRTYDVSGPGQVSDDLLEGQRVNTTYSRNASHLQFSASTGKGQSSGSVYLIPVVTLPLLPGKCMFGDFVNTSKNLVLPPPLTQSCLAESSQCGGVLCNFTTLYQLSSTVTYETCITVDPCNETIQIVIRDSLDVSVFDEVFDKTRSMNSTQTAAQRFTLYVILDHYNYSMEATMLIAIQNFPVGNITILPKQRFILDRTSCDPFISYPAAPDKWGTSMRCHAPVTTGPSSSKKSDLTLAIVIPVTLVIVALAAAAVVLIFWLVRRHYKRRSDFNFQRVAFNDIDFDTGEEDDDDD